MIVYLLTGKPRPRGYLIREFIVLGVTLFISVPLAWWSSDRTPPWVRLYGEVLAPTYAGGLVKLKWHTTPLVRYCPGVLQVELISGSLIWPVFSRPVSTRPKPGQTEYFPEPWPIPIAMPPGRGVYRVTSFWYCNWLQEKLDWPIVQVGPDIPLTILPKE